MISPLVGTAIVMQSDFATIFYAVAGIGLVAFVLSLMLPAPTITSITSNRDAFDDDDERFSLKALPELLRQSNLWPWYAVIVVNMFFVGILFGFLPVRVELLHYDSLTSGALLSAAALSYLLVQPIAGIVADRVDSLWTLQIGLLDSALGIIMVPFAEGLPLMLITIVAGMGIGMVWTNSDAMMSSLARQGQLGSTMGMAGSFKELGDMLGPLVIGLIAQAFGLIRISGKGNMYQTRVGHQ